MESRYVNVSAENYWVKPDVTMEELEVIKEYWLKIANKSDEASGPFYRETDGSIVMDNRTDEEKTNDKNTAIERLKYLDLFTGSNLVGELV
jgi:hypothetical protein